ncbi:unnamed protein product [Cylindrotheca closterium]|uniref:PABS domain-containing protein n=1 Tax=Cylindrotheca closterium TaxID=2856 RepID=A0AAD2G902_9STRA|nr:unnamed protein product [Cylindrotheca closterium]
MRQSESSNATHDSTKKYKGINNGWFTETASMWPGQKFSLALENYSEDAIIHHQKSEFQEILVFRSVQYGKVFVIDGILQLTERDECAFHEMMVHLPLFSHPNPKHVLIVGGGDGVCLREVCRHSEVQKVTLVEIDPMVLRASKDFLRLVPPELLDGSDPRVEIVHADAAEYLKEEHNHCRFDVILADTLDPLGPAESLFEPEFYEKMHDSLKPSGIICIQGESFFIHLNLIRDLFFVPLRSSLTLLLSDIFKPTYWYITGGQIGFILCRKGDAKSCRNPVRHCKFQSDLKWYNRQIHRAAFVLPHYIQQELSEVDLWNRGGFDEFSVPERDDYDKDRCFLLGCSIQ